jgi:hypothetical protein
MGTGATGTVEARGTSVVEVATAAVVGGATGTTAGSPEDRSAQPITAARPKTNIPVAPAVAILAICAGGSDRRAGSVIA